MLTLNKKTIRSIIVALLFIILLYFISKIYSIFTPFLLAFLIAYLLEPLVRFLEEKGVNRTWGIVIIYIALIGILSAIIIYTFPKLIIELNKFADTIPLYTEQIQGYITTLQNKYTRFSIPESIRMVINDTIQDMEDYLIDIARKIAQVFLQSLTKILDIILAPILAFYLLKDFELIKSQFLSVMPTAHRKDLISLGQQMDRVLKSFLRGHLLVALFVGSLTAIGLTLVKMEFALIIGMIAGAFNIIPYFGPLLSMIPAVGLALLQSQTLAIYVILIMFAVQQVEGNIISPKILGKSLGLHPLVIILALLAGGHLYGLFGMIFAVPLTGILKVLLSFIIEKIVEM